VYKPSAEAVESLQTALKAQQEKAAKREGAAAFHAKKIPLAVECKSPQEKQALQANFPVYPRRSDLVREVKALMQESRHAGERRRQKNV
jgi:hypothetical protein